MLIDRVINKTKLVNREKNKPDVVFYKERFKLRNPTEEFLVTSNIEKTINISTQFPETEISCIPTGFAPLLRIFIPKSEL